MGQAGGTRTAKRAGIFKISLRDTAMLGAAFLAGFLQGRAMLSGGLLPFGPAAIVAAFMHRRWINPYIVTIGVFIGLLTLTGLAENIGFNFAIAGVSAAIMTAAALFGLKIGMAAASFTIVFSHVLSAFVFKRGIMLSILSTLTEAVLSLLMCIVIANIFALLSKRKFSASAKEVICLIFFLVALFIGLGGINIAGVHIVNIFALYASIFAAHLFGAPIGAAAGISAGAAAVLGGAYPGFAAVTAVSAMLGGLFLNHKKPVLTAGFFAAFVMTLVYAKKGAADIAPLAEGVIASILFLITPEKKGLSLSSIFEKENSKTAAIDVTFAFLLKKKEGSSVSGDSMLNLKTEDGRFIFALADGMGSGAPAHSESALAIALIREFLSCGADKKSMLDSINKLLLLKSGADMHTTLDLCTIDPYSAEAELTKFASPHSYIVRGDRITKLNSGSLPIGVVENAKPITHTFKLLPGDMLVMFTDGISDAELNSFSLRGVIRSAAGLKKADLAAKSIMSAALNAFLGEAKDDMTVAVIKITEA